MPYGSIRWSLGPYNANVRVLGSYQTDEIRAHTHRMGDRYYNAAGSGPAVDCSGGNYTQTDSFGGAETRGENTALAPRVVAF